MYWICVVKLLIGVVLFISEVFILFEKRILFIGLQSWKLFIECRKCVGIVFNEQLLRVIVWLWLGNGMIWLQVLMLWLIVRQLVVRCGRKCVYSLEQIIWVWVCSSYLLRVVMMFGFWCEVKMQFSFCSGKCFDNFSESGVQVRLLLGLSSRYWLLLMIRNWLDWIFLLLMRLLKYRYWWLLLLNSMIGLCCMVGEIYFVQVLRSIFCWMLCRVSVCGVVFY